MSLRKVAPEDAKSVALTEDDLYVLKTIYRSRLRRFCAIFFLLVLLIALNIRPDLMYAVIKNGDDAQSLWGIITAITLFLFIPFGILFYESIWKVRKDLRSGVKIEIREQITGKNYFPYTNQYFLSLSDADYMHHEVTPEIFEAVQVGDYYPVCFATHSRYPFTLRSRVTLM